MNAIWKTYVAAFAIAMSVSTAGLSTAWAGRGDHGKWAQELNLTAEQQTKMKQIHDEFKKTMPGKREAMKAAREDLQTALRGTASDVEVREKFQALQKRQDEFAQARFEKILSIRAILTPEQRQKFKGMDRHKGFWKNRPDSDDDEE